MTSRSVEQVDKDIHRRQMGIKVRPSGNATQGAQRNLGGKLGATRSTAAVDKDAHRRAMGIKVPARGRLSDAATGRLDNIGAERARSGGAVGGIKGTKGQRRDRIGRFA